MIVLEIKEFYKTMNPEKKQNIEKNLKIIAKREGITPEEVIAYLAEKLSKEI